MRILLVEDEPRAAQMLARGLREQTYAVDVAGDGAEALYHASITDYDAVILDVMLPRRDGFSVCQQLRASGSMVPVLMLTARDEIESRIEGLDIGADDYVTKPFDMSELTARILAVLRRTTSTSQEVLQFGDISFNRLTRETACKGKRVRLTPKEQTFLEQLMMTPGASVSREELLQTVWRINFDPGSNLLDTHVARLRSKLKQIKCDVAIVTRRGEGFALELGPDQPIPGRP
jgi:two-component system copper resistance phosphate regulon response regulator CusR